ncbi:MAG: RNA 2',3'-cyclic phosphodiesterase [Noviherbaspirillum sp.]
MNANATEMLRLFFALWPDDATRTSLMQLQALIRGRTVLYNNLHLTLAFLGPQPAAVLASAKEILTHLSSPATSLTLDRLGYFTRKRLAWVGAHQVPDELVSLQKELRDGLLQRGITFDDRKDFKAHITLARDASLPPDIVFDPIVWHASQVALVQSATDDQGTAYRVLASRSLDQR